MPFVTQDHRDKPDISIPGDRCYIFYKEMVDAWKANPRWTTANSIYMLMKYETGRATSSDRAAYELAWQVFFIKYVMPYEDLKEKENGTI